jgi:uncharacterized double-CXXCG motif protein
MRFFRLNDVYPPRYSGEYRAHPELGLPGIRCPACGKTGAGIGERYPAVDLSGLSEREQFKPRLEKDFAEFTRLRELVRPLAPAGAPLNPGTTFGPLVGTATGEFAQLLLQNAWTVLMRRESLEQLQAEGLRGLKGCPTGLRFQEKHPPELLELQIESRGLLHPDCLPPGKAAPCATCGSNDFSMPREPLLDAASLPTDRDLFRLINFATVIVGTERFVETVTRLGFEEVKFLELPVR